MKAGPVRVSDPAETSERVALLQQLFASLNQGLDGFVQEMLRHTSPEGELVEDPAWPGAGTYRGHAEMERRARELFEGLDWSVEVEDYVETESAVVALQRWTAASRTSGAPTEMRQAWLITFDGGLIERIRVYFDRDEALRAAEG